MQFTHANNEREGVIHLHSTIFIQDETALKEKEKALSKAEDVFLQLKQADKEDNEALETAQRKFQAVSSGLLTSDDGEDATLQDQLMSGSFLNCYNILFDWYHFKLLFQEKVN